MKSILVVSDDGAAATELTADFGSVGIHVLGAIDRRNVVRQVVRDAPDLLVWWMTEPNGEAAEILATLARTAPLPVVVFTQDPDAEGMARVVDAGAHAYVVNGYGVERLRPLLHLAQARFGREQRLREALDDVTHRFEERKLVDRAKGILMRATQMSEEDAFRLLRTVSMRDNQRVGQVSRQLIDAARYAETVNRAGQLRMLSQRIVKLYALLCTQTEPASAQALLTQSVERVERQLDTLARDLSKATFGDLIDAVQAVWAELRQPLALPAELARLSALDAAAERLLGSAERLTSALEVAGQLQTLHLVNMCGRQRMLSQRLTKQVLLGGLLDGAAGDAARDGAAGTVGEFEQALSYLNGAPLGSPDIRQLLEAADRSWHELRQGSRRAETPTGRRALAAASESLLDVFERLTERYERSLQVLTR
ncbi:type IV pili methyl-accepting chemotaxis transducer N-terminal domain-containing protein [Caldimonas brevitalea]|uniref:Response regulator NasT n=1 Tax=Caldimonas brevitalea TaxID=413882 RepID=A0A0G3BRF5_9BURK|nr:type IV pili methyl-accepting chemotaxis transducer N-terminal domain-containing protein [Caldimonas brevitalea]AKJ29941.1 response regulator NasT [Caldimonas brevitalea]